MKIAFVSIYDAQDVSNWSGTPFHMAQALERHCESVQYIGNLSIRPSLRKRVQRKLWGFWGKQLDMEREPEILEQFAMEILQRADKDVDVFFAPSSLPLAFLQTDKPVVFYADATFASMLNFYDNFSHLSQMTIRNAEKAEQRALDHAALAIYSSEWAAQSAMKDYHANPSKVKVIEYGANVESGKTQEEILQLIAAKDPRHCHLLFLGVDWIRKGGPKAVEIVAQLNKKGIAATLHIVGVKELPAEAHHPFVAFHGFISKSTEEGRNKIKEILEKSHFLLLPTIADCTPIVYAEANSYSLPVITTDVGGVGTLVQNGVNGFALPVETNANDYAEVIEKYFSDFATYQQLAQSSLATYENRLNWDVCAKRIVNELQQLITSRS